MFTISSKQNAFGVTSTPTLTVTLAILLSFAVFVSPKMLKCIKYIKPLSLSSIFSIIIQIFWHTWSLDLEEEVASFHTLQDSPLAQSHRWKISSPWDPFLRCLVHTSPWCSTGLQILVQKWRAQQCPSIQSDDRRQGSPSCPKKSNQTVLPDGKTWKYRFGANEAQKKGRWLLPSVAVWREDTN